jgi:hypothetical protein
MFHSHLAAGVGETIQVPDIEPNSFHVMLKFIYTGEFQKDTLSPEESLSVLYTAKKYYIRDLELICMDALKHQVNHSTAIIIFQTAQLLDVDDLKNDAYNYITRHFEELCGTEEFLNLTLENMAMFLKDDDTHGSELDLFFGVLRYVIVIMT